jgi:hypothetical protein
MHIFIREGAHLWRTVFCTGRSQLTFYSVKVLTCGGQIFAQADYSEGDHLWRTVICRSHLTFYSVKVPTCGGQFFAQAGHTSHFIQ